MNDKKICFITCVNNEEKYRELLLYISRLKIPAGYKIEFAAVRNAKSMASGYNRGMAETDAKYKVYLHQDVFILNREFISEMLGIFNADEKIGLMGVIGGKKLMPDAIWWNYNNIYGTAYDNRKIMRKLYCLDIKGPYEKVETIDGLIMMTQYDIPFREDLFDGWHYYDISQCAEFIKRGYSVVVPNQKDSWCLHDCGPSWDEGTHEHYREIFIKEYSKDILPLVSILIPTYNRPEYFKLALESAINQTYLNTEIIIGDDSTNDETEILVRENYLSKYPNICYYHNKKNLGQFDNDLKLLEMASGEYVNFLMDDDLFYPEKIEKMMKYFVLYNDDELSLVTSHRMLIDESGKSLGIFGKNDKLIKQDSVLNGSDLANFMLATNNNIIGEPTTALFKKSKLKVPFGTFEGRRYYCNVDQAAWYELLSQGKAVFINEVLSCYRWHTNQQLKGQRAILGGMADYAHEVLNARKKGFLAKNEELTKAFQSCLNYIKATCLKLDESSFTESEKKVLAEINFFENEMLQTQKKLNSSFKYGDISIHNQSDVEFTGERLVINEDTEKNTLNVIEEHLERYKFACQHTKGKTVLDAACGAGYGTKMIADSGAKHVTGVDISEETVNHAKVDYPGENVTYEQGDVTHLAFSDSSFDMIVSFETIEHIKSGPDWIAESARLLNDNGIFIVSTPNRDISGTGYYFEEHPNNSYHQYEYKLQEFIGDLLIHYDVLEVYGQTFFADSERLDIQCARQIRKMNMSYKPTVNIDTGYPLIRLDKVKNVTPAYYVAVCRKKAVTPSNRAVPDERVQFRNTPTKETELSAFYSLGNGVSVGQGFESNAPQGISIGNNVQIKKDAYFIIPFYQDRELPYIEIGEGCDIGNRNTISSVNRIIIESQVITASNVHITDVNHDYRNIGIPIRLQGVDSYDSEVVIGQGSWIGNNCVIAGRVKIGRGCVIGANSFVNRDIPDYCVAVGSPAKVIKYFDFKTGIWVSENGQAKLSAAILDRKKLKPILTLGIFTYNRASYLDKCLYSILRSVGNDSLVEVLVCDNASTDETSDVVKKYTKYTNLVYHRNKENIGPDRNMLKALETANGEYVIAVGDDDYYSYGFIYKVINTIYSNRNCGLIYFSWSSQRYSVALHEGINDYVKDASYYSGACSLVAYNKSGIEKISDKEKFMYTKLNQVYLQFSILRSNPNYVVLSGPIFDGTGTAEKDNYNFAEVFIKNYFDILYYFQNDIAQETMSNEKLKVIDAFVLPWCQKIVKGGVQLKLENILALYNVHYKNEPYYEEYLAKLTQILSTAQ